MRISAAVTALLALVATATVLAQDPAPPPTRVCENELYGCPTHPEILATWPAQCPVCQSVLSVAQWSDTPRTQMSPIASQGGGAAPAPRGGGTTPMPGRGGRTAPTPGQPGGTMPTPGQRGGIVPAPGQQGGMVARPGPRGGMGVRPNERSRERGPGEPWRDPARRNEGLRQRFHRFGPGTPPFGSPDVPPGTGSFENPYAGSYFGPLYDFNPYGGYYLHPYWGYGYPFYYWNPWNPWNSWNLWNYWNPWNSWNPWYYGW